TIDRDERSCNDNCFYNGLVAKGDRVGLVVTGRHRVAEEARGGTPGGRAGGPAVAGVKGYWPGSGGGCPGKGCSPGARLLAPGHTKLAGLGRLEGRGAQGGLIRLIPLT